jgi:hypothetical protein
VPKHSVLPIKVWRRLERDEKLHSQSERPSAT